MNWDEQPGNWQRLAQIIQHSGTLWVPFIGQKNISGLSMGYSWMPPKSDENHRFPMKRQFRVYRGLRKNHQATAPLRLNFGFNSCSKTSEIRFNYLSQNTPLD